MIALALVAAFVIVPLVEIAVIIQVGHAIGAWWTVLLLAAESILGAVLVRHEGRRSWQALRATLGSARVPGRELADSALILVGGVLLLTPGFVTDAMGFVLVLPFTRPLARRLLLRWATRRSLVARLATQEAVPTYGGARSTRRPRTGGGPGSAGRGSAGRGGGGQVIDGEVIDGEVIDGQAVEHDRLAHPDEG